MSHRCQADLSLFLPIHLPLTRNLGAECGMTWDSWQLINIHLLAMPFPSKPVHTENPIAQAPLLPSPGVSVLRPILLKVVIAQETAGL